MHGLRSLQQSRCCCDTLISSDICISRYVFKQPDLLRLAFLHGTPALDTMSWVGDSLLYFLLTEQLPARYPNATLKAMHAAREKLLSRTSCAL